MHDLFNLCLIFSLLAMGGALALIAVLDAGLSNAGRYGLLFMATVSWLLCYPLMF